MGKFRDLTGQTFDRLTVIERGTGAHKSTNAHWWCRCICGSLRLINGGNLTRHHTKSCGCLLEEKQQQGNPKHGLHDSPEYRIWHHMKERCLNQNDKEWHNYGGRGITVCETWQHSFEAFYASMGPRPSPQHSLDRINNNQGYSPDNTAWVTYDIQCRNKRTNRMITIDGQTACLTDWLRKLGMGDSTYRQRRNRMGMSDVEALTMPLAPNSKKWRVS